MRTLRSLLLATVLALTVGSAPLDTADASAPAYRPAAAVGGAGGSGADRSGGGAVTVVAYRLPLRAAAVVLTPFAPPTSRYGPGHLGVDLRAEPGQPVYAAAAGVAQFAGPVAGRGVLVLAHADGISTEYEPLRLTIRRGQQVTAGSMVGRVEGTHRSCSPRNCLHWGARRGSAYLDPLGLLLPLGPVRLLPW